MREIDGHRGAWAALASLLVGFACATLPAIVANIQSGGGVAYDAVQFHLPQINYFLSHPLELVDYPAYAPTLPGYHWTMALIARAMGFDAVDNGSLSLRLVHWGICAAGLIAAAWFARRLAGARASTVAWLPPVVPLFASWYSLQAAVYFGTDLVALAIFVVFLVAVENRPQRAVMGAVAATALVFVRHMFAPVVFTDALQRLATEPRESLRATAVGTLKLIALPMLLLAIYVCAWGGLVPPGLPSELNHGGIFPQVWLHAFAFLGVTAGVFAPLAAAQWLPFWKSTEGRWWLICSVAAAAILWAISPSNYQVDAGRWGSVVWTLAAHTPLIGSRSPLLLAVAVFGAVFVAYLAWRGRRLERFPTELAAMALYISGLALTSAAYQRYLEPVTLLCLGLFFARTAADAGRASRWWLALMTVSYLLASVCRLYGQ